jgi:hypothetical protein
MKRLIKTVFWGAIIVIMALSFMAGCEDKNNKSQEINSSKSTQPETSDTDGILSSGLKSISNGASVSLLPDYPMTLLMVPKSPNSTLSEITAWLENASPYNGEISSSKNTSSTMTYAAYTGPSVLYINTPDGHKITIEPVIYYASSGTGYERKYLSNVLLFSDDNRKMYITSGQLYDWLKNDKWKSEFDREQNLTTVSSNT